MTPKRMATKQALSNRMREHEIRVKDTSVDLYMITDYLHTSALWEIMDCQDRDWKASRKSSHYEYWGKAA